MSLTNITAKFLRKTKACKEGVAWYRAHSEVHDWPWEVVCAALEEDGQKEWSRWVRLEVAIYGTAEDRAALRGDPDAWVRQTVAKFGTAEDRVMLRDDPNAVVRRAVAIYGSTEDRTALRNDPGAWVRWAVECYRRRDTK